jgi:surface protein
VTNLANSTFTALVSVVLSLEFLSTHSRCFCFYVFTNLFLDCVHRHPPTAFRSASAFNADLSRWNTAAVTSMSQSTSAPPLSLLLLLFFHLNSVHSF